MSLDGFPVRLKMAMGSHSGNSFAKLCEFSESLLRQYLAGQSLPGLDKAVRIAEVSGVDLRWLATGEGAMHPGKVANLDKSSEHLSSIDALKLKNILIAIRKVVGRDKLTLAPFHEAELASGIYELTKSDDEISESAIVHFINLLKREQI